MQRASARRASAEAVDNLEADSMAAAEKVADSASALDRLEVVDLVVNVDLPGTEEPTNLKISRVSEPASVVTKVKGTNSLWANVWSCAPLAATLASAALAGPAKPKDGSRPLVVEFACGCGIPSLLAAARGADVLATDVSLAGLALVRRNAGRLGIEAREAAADEAETPEPGPSALGARTNGSLRTARCDFMRPAAEAEAALPACFLRPSLVVCSEATYISSMGRPLARWFARLLRDTGLGLVVDAMRPSSEGFGGACDDEGLGAIAVERERVRAAGVVIPGCRVFVLFRPAEAEAEAGSPAGTTALPAEAMLDGCAPGRVPAEAAELAQLVASWLARWAAAPGEGRAAFCLE